ncbi:MAG TPA: GNAT family N-acetyltransferase [Gemmatimonadales bacterium]|nr:GNAT family N-acetyltransferase [Gemmatimonadales bacterium]
MLPAVPPPVRVRPATPADLPAIGRLGALLVRLHHDLDPARFLAATPGTAEGYAAYLGTRLERTDGVVLVAEGDGTVLGYVWGGLEGTDYMALRGPAGALYDLVVDPAHRDRGVGRMLLEAATAALASLGAPRVVLSTAARNAAAQRLFTRAGFRPTMIEMTRELGGGEG